MQIIAKDGNKESVYELTYDCEEIKQLIGSIIENCSVRIKQKCCIEAMTFWEAENIINSKVDWSGNKIYENVKDLHEEPTNEPMDFLRRDPRPYSFIADLLIVPELAEFLIHILNEEEVDYTWFLERRELTRAVDIKKQIMFLNCQIDIISKFNIEKKVAMLKQLEILMKQLKEIPNINYNLLEVYYDMTERCVQLNLVEEVTTHKRNIKTIQ